MNIKLKNEFCIFLLFIKHLELYMKILVALKQVPDTESKIKIAQDGKSLDFVDTKWITSPYDEYALEEALRIKESIGAEITAVSIGDVKSKSVLQSALALGVQNAVLLNSGQDCDPIAVANILADFAKDNNFDLIFLGNKAELIHNFCRVIHKPLKITNKL